MRLLVTNLAVKKRHKNTKENFDDNHFHNFLRSFKFSFLHKRTDTQLLLKNIIYTSCLTSRRKSFDLGF